MERDSFYVDDFSLSNKLSTYISISAAKGLQEILKSNLGPKGTYKILVSGSNEIKLTKNGNILLKEMQIQNPIASLIARSVSAQNYFSGDGTTSIILILGELFRNIEKYLEKGIHPQIISEGINVGRREIERWLSFQIVKPKERKKNLIKMAHAIFSTKLKNKNSLNISKIVVEAAITVHKKNENFDVNLIEIIQMDHRSELESRFIKGIVLDHGARHPDMPKILHNAFILLCNVNLEYEKTEVNSTFLFSSPDQREKLYTKERETIDKKINKIIQLKRSVSKNKSNGFVLINQKGIDSISLDALCREGILGIRRTKRKNMERISLLCNAIPVNASEDISPEILGFAGLIYEQTIGEEKYTFIENVTNPFSGTILIRGNNPFLRTHLEEVIRDGLKTIKLCLEDTGYLLGGGIIESKGRDHLIKYAQTISGGKKFGVLAFGESLLCIPSILFENKGQRFYKFTKSMESRNSTKYKIPYQIEEEKSKRTNRILDCFSSKKQVFNSVCFIATQILQIDEIMIGKGLG